MGGRVPRPIEDAQDLAGVGQGNHERMVAPGAVVSDVDALCALAVGADQGALQVDACLGKEVSGLVGPDLESGVVAEVLEGLDVLGAKASAEIAGRGRVGNAAGSQGVQEDFILAAELDVFQTSTIAQGVISDIEDMIRFVVGPMDLQQVQALIDGFDQSELAGEQVHGADATIGQAVAALANFIMVSPGREPGLVTAATFPPVDAPS